MADTAFQIQYRQEFVMGFEDMQSRLRSCCTTETVVSGEKATFLVADSNGASAVTRGVNGLIPARADDLNQHECQLAEWHDLVRKTRFNIFASQGDQNRIMQETTMGVLNRQIDDDIIAELDSATLTTGSAATATNAMVTKAKVILGNAFVPVEEEDNMFAVVTPAFMGYLEEKEEFASADYVDVKPYTGPSRNFRRWRGVNWIEHPRLTGVGTNAEKCYMFHRNAIGHAVDKEKLETLVGYDEEQDYSWARATAFMGSKKLQNTGIIQMVHDGSAYVA